MVPRRADSTQLDATWRQVDRAELLLVEDYADLADMMQLLLEAEGYLVKVASSVAEAVRAYTKDRTALVLSDLSLPDGSGWDLLAQLQSRGRVRAIALSGFEERDCGTRCRQAGFTDYLVKPFEERELVAAVRRALDA